MHWFLPQSKVPGFLDSPVGSLTLSEEWMGWGGGSEGVAGGEEGVGTGIGM